MPFILPSPDRKKRLQSIQRHLAEHKADGSVKDLSAAVSLMVQDPEFQSHIARSPQLQKPVNSQADLMGMAWSFLYSLLYADDFVAAAMMLWDSESFCAEPRCTQLVWNALMTKRMVCVIGAGGTGKTYSASAYFLLSWITDPEWSRIQLASASKDHLQKNLFADVVRLHDGASMLLPGSPDTESISLQKRRAMGIFTLILPGGPQSRGKIKGSHTKPRPPHPKFGRRSRVFCLVDECQECPQNIFEEIPNRFSTVAGDDVDHLKFVICANPKDVFSKFGACAKPIHGWDSVKREDETWESELGWTVVSLDAMKHENVVQKRIVFPGFVTWDGVQGWLKKCNGNTNDPQMWTYVYGKFPPSGLASCVIKQAHLTRSEGEWIFDSETTGKAGGDPAFVGDRPSLACGRTGRAIGWIDYNGDRHMLSEPRVVIQIDAVTVMPHGDSQDLSDNYMDRIKPLGVHPSGFGIDMTGPGRGTHDIIRRQWATKVNPLPEGVTIAMIHGIEYGSSPSMVKIADEDTSTPKELYDRMCSELWFAAAKLFEFDVIRIGKGVDLKVFSELSARQGGLQPGLGKKLTVESKTDFKKRTGMDSPDLADATLIMLHVARITTPGLIPKAKDTQPVKPERQIAAWTGFNQAFGACDIQGMGGSELADMQKD